MNKIWKAVKEETLEHEYDLYVLMVLGCTYIVFKQVLNVHKGVN